MKNKIITAAEAAQISEVNRDFDFKDVMDLVEEYAKRGRKEYVIRDKKLFKKWGSELVELGYEFKDTNEGWALSWDNPKEMSEVGEHLETEHIELSPEKKYFIMYPYMGKIKSIIFTFEYFVDVIMRRNDHLANKNK